MNVDKAPGRVRTLTEDETSKLKEAWLRLGEICNITPGEHEKTGDDVTPNENSAATNDKYGQNKGFQQYLHEAAPEDIRRTIWSMAKMDHPDSLILRFLRARKWDVNKAVFMLISTVKWRTEMHIEDEIVQQGEAVALEEKLSKQDEEFLFQYRSGKCFMRGTDRQGRPICIVKPRLHNQSKQSAKTMENFTLHTIESTRMLLRDPVDTASLIFDLTGFGLKNMDNYAVKFIIKIFEANYPESLGEVSVHNAPWLFQGLWRLIRGWLDPVVASKIHFTNSTDDLIKMIPQENLPVEFGGTDNWSYMYIEPQPGENSEFADTSTRYRIQKERDGIIHAYQQNTIRWVELEAGDPQEVDLLKGRTELAEKLKANYWRLDPYIRARTIYDRAGFVSKDGTVNFNPTV